ncbi:endospore germination permease [Clostridium aestuarii]|uniref:Endospore germination permease n=1 Tax=Clostridium aestuarii TaxID=338193 RepID=A0ABT4D2Y8_9CLOT|nr:endospore germination permease [Clostridium aestuarii]MCY6485594.1 endospore germination permease [Clostridium aestuarii]
MDNKNIVSKYDLFVTTVVTVIGTGIFSYPSELCKFVGSDAWIVILLAGVIFVPLLYLLHKSVELNNYARFIDILQNNFGNVMGKIIAFVFASMGIFIISLQMRTFIEVMKMYLLQRTPTEFMLLVMILTGTFLIRGEFEDIIKFNELAFWLMFIPVFLAIPFILLNEADFTNIFPILSHKPIEYLKAGSNSFYSFLGFGILYMILPFLKEKKSIIKVTFRSLVFIIVFYILVIMTTIIVFTSKYNTQLLWPTITMISIVDIPGTFVERWEGIAMVFWLLFYFTTYVNIYYFSSEIIRDVFNLEDIKISLMLIIPFIYVIALYPENITEVYQFQKKVEPFVDSGMIAILPLVLVIIAFIKGRRSKGEV